MQIAWDHENGKLHQYNKTTCELTVKTKFKRPKLQIKDQHVRKQKYNAFEQTAKCPLGRPVKTIAAMNRCNEYIDKLPQCLMLTTEALFRCN